MLYMIPEALPSCALQMPVNTPEISVIEESLSACISVNDPDIIRFMQLGSQELGIERR